MRKIPRFFPVFIAVFLLVSCCGLNSKPQPIPSSVPVHLNMATFDSGFGGFFTAKSMTDQALPLLKKYNVVISVTHYGDTGKAPYGNKPPTEIARLTQLGVEKALGDGASAVVIACNTASTQHGSVVANIKQTYPEKEKYILSIITPTIRAVKEDLDRQLLSNDAAVIAIFATPATVKSMTYPEKLAASYQGKLEKGDIRELGQKDWKDSSKQVANLFSTSLLQLPKKKTVFIYQFAPANWVGMIEEGAADETKQQIVAKDVRQFLENVPPEHKLDVVGFFCTHYPVFKDIIRNELVVSGYAKPATRFIEQGALAATYAYDTIVSQYADHVRNASISEQALKQLIERARPKIVISGDNVNQTENLVKTIFPDLADVPIVKESFAPMP